MESRIKENVMRRVHTIHAVRPFTSLTALAALVGLVSLYEIGKLVFVAQVFRNMPAIQDVSALVEFFLTAYLNTDFAVQLCTVLLVLAVAWVARDVARMLARSEGVAIQR